MKSIHVHLFALFALASSAIVRAQGTFENLNFEEASIVPISGQQFAITVANALPDWTVDYGTVQQTQIYYNAPSLGAPQVTLFASGYPGSASTVFDGNFSVLLQAGLVNGVVLTSASISQTGQIPSGTQSLLFDSASGGFSSQQPPEVFIGNDLLTLFPVGTGQGVSTSYTIYGANIFAWAGQTEQLTFSSPLGDFTIDDISFSTGAVPEPSALALTGIGGVLFALYRRFAAKWQ
jgi:hypothetical protein